MNAIKHLIWTAFATLFILATVFLVFYVAFHYFSGWRALSAVIGEVGILVLFAYCIRWWRYPGLFYGASAGHLVGRYLAAVFFFTGGLLIIGLLAQFHALAILKNKDLGCLLGLEFRYKKGQRVQVSSAAPADLYPGAVGTVVGFTVIGQQDHRMGPPESVGAIFYKLQFSNGVTLEVPDREVA